MDVKEFNIPVPWGHVAAKAWGNEQNTPILALHGIGDNAGTFDRLIPLLPTSFYYICIDLPSHGKSTHYPPHLFITALDNILTLKLVVDYLDRKKYILMGHSWGGQTQMLFTQLYPEYVLKLVLFDAFYLRPISINSFKKVLIDKFEDLARINDNLITKPTPLYTYEEAVSKLMNNRNSGELCKESAEALVKRMLIPHEEGKFRLSTDPRLKAFLNPLFDMKYVIQLAKFYQINCPILFVYPSDSERYKYLKGVVNEYKRYRHCVFKTVTGNHDVHTNKPEVVAPIVNKFLLDMQSKL